MKILQINAVYNLSSTGRTCSDFQRFANENGHICRTAFCYGGEEKDGYIIGNKSDRNIHGAFSRIFGKQAWFSKGATKNLIKYIDEFAPDIIQLRNLHGNYINFPMLVDYITEKNIATVVTLHDCWPFTGRCCHYTVDKCYKWQTGCFECPRLKKDNQSFVDKSNELWHEKRQLWGKIPRLAVNGVSKWIMEESQKSPLLENAKIFTYIYNGIDKNVFKFNPNVTLREKYNLQNKKILLAVASGWTACKGLLDIIELSKMLPDNYHIVMIGNLAEPADLGERILNIPATENVAELVDWYSTADVLINMSKEETFGKVSAEALMCGTPVVCFNTTANPELVGEKCGAVCETESVEDYKNAVLEVAGNGRDYYSNSCVDFAHENFITENNFKKYIELYEELLEV